MRQLRAFLHRLTGLIRRDARERELQAELESHFQLHIDDNIRAGMSHEDARRAAILTFGPIESIKEDIRDRASIPLLEILIQDVRYALRRMRRQPGFTALIAVTLALGVGANAATLGLVDVLMFRTPAHVPQPERIMTVGRAGNYVQYQQLAERLELMTLTAYTRHGLSFGRGTDAAELRAECVTPSYFAVAGTSTSRGRGFTSDDDAIGAPRTIVLSDAFWARAFDRDPRVLGTSVIVADRPYDVIGIAPPGFTGLGLGAIDGWVLLAASPEACSFTGTNLLRSTGGSWLTVAGRLAVGATREQAAAELAAAEAHTERPRVRGPNRTVVEGSFTLTPVYESRRLSLSRDSRLALWLAGGALVLLLLACTNVAGLLWTHTLDRRREMAVRLQLGASRRRVFGQLVVEHLLMAGLGGLAAFAIATWISDGVRIYFPLAADVSLLSRPMLALVGVLAVSAGFASGVIPAIQATRAGTERHLRTSHSVMMARGRMRSGLLSLQFALALVLVTAAGLFVGSVDRYRGDFAYDLDRVLVASIDFRKSSLRSPHEIHAIFDALQQRVRQLPGVERASLSAAPVLGSGGLVMVVGIRRPGDETGGLMNALSSVGADYFQTLGVAMTSGRAFTAADQAGPPVVVLSQPLAARLFMGANPVGQRLLIGNTEREVVGVNVPYRADVDTDRQGDSQVFVPMSETGDAEATPQVLLVRTRGQAAAALPAVTAALQGAAPDLPFVDVGTLEQLADVQARSWLLGASVFGLFGTLAVVLAAIGIYGSLAFSIRQRTTEIGVRVALGATRRDIARTVLQHGAIVIAIGVLLGIGGALAGSRYLESLLFNISAADPITIAAAAAAVTSAALAGCIVPALRAMRVDPATALRTE